MARTLHPPTGSHARQDRFAQVIGVTGEILVTLGVLTTLFWVWHLGINDWIQGNSQRLAATEVSEEWALNAAAGEFGKARGDADGRGASSPPPVVPVAAEGATFALIYVPRFGEDYVRPVAEGVDLVSVLNDPELGVGRYPQSTELGELGNFAIAGHRTTYGASFALIGELRVGDRIYIEVEEGWYSYRFRNLEYVWPTEIDVLNPIPKVEGEEPTQRLLTMTSCHPRFSEAERIIAYSVFDTWYPRSDGPPSEIAHLTGQVT